MTINYNNAFFSILIANHNNGNYLLEALESVYAQTYADWEIVLLDDGSTDASESVYEALKDNPKIRVYYNGQNRGVGYTKHKLITLAKGTICGFLDADDRLEPEALEIMVQAHLQHPECALVYSTFGELRSDGYLAQTALPLGSLDDGEDLLISTNRMVSHFATFKREIYRKTTGINTMLLSAEDRDLYLKLEEQGDLLYIDKCLYQYRVDNTNSISRGNKEKTRFAQYYLALANLTAYSRRISMKHRLYIGNRKKYKERMIGELRRLYENRWTTWSRNVFLKYMFFYLHQNRWSLKAIKRIIKLVIQ